MSNVDVVSNTSGNHLSILQEMIESGRGRLIIASPFLASDIKSLLSEFRFSGIRQFDLITTVKPNDLEQITKPKVLRDFLEYFRAVWPDIQVRLHIDNDLHGKVYIVDQPNCICMLVSSANFTRNGLEQNHEWGLKINDRSIVETVIEEIFSEIEFPEVTWHQVLKACMFADEYKKKYPKVTEPPKIDGDSINAIYSVEGAKNLEPKYFLKPLGTKEDPITLEQQRDFSALHQNLHFSKKKPKGVLQGDIVITTAIGPGSLLAWFKVTGDCTPVSKEDLARQPRLARWPWYMEGQNQSQKFGKEWWKHNIRRQDALSEFLEKFPGIPVTKAGGFTLNTLNRGNDKVLITKEFGEFLIGKIRAAVKE